MVKCAELIIIDKWWLVKMDNDPWSAICLTMLMATFIISGNSITNAIY